jgi:hypothetical protein
MNGVKEIAVISSFREPARLAVAVATLLCVAIWTTPIRAERPTAPKLLPKSTIAYLRIADSQELIEAFQNTTLGKLGRDDKIKPLVTQLYGSAAQAFTQVEDQIGVSLSEILEIPQGEVCVAVVGREQGDQAVVIFMDVGNNMATVRKLMDVAIAEAERDGKTKRIEKIDDAVLTILDTDATFCERESTVLFSTSDQMLKEMLKIWDGDEGAETLAGDLPICCQTEGSGSGITFRGFLAPAVFTAVGAATASILRCTQWKPTTATSRLVTAIDNQAVNSGSSSTCSNT